MYSELNPIVIDLNKLTVKVLDQRKIPEFENFMDLKTIEDAHFSIKEMLVRGAPLIGFTAIAGLAVYFKSATVFSETEMIKAVDYLNSSRPTAINLKNDLVLSVEVIKQSGLKDCTAISKVLFNYAQDRIDELKQLNTNAAKSIFDSLAKTGKKKFTLMTICNTGRLACGTLGTALGVVEYFQSQKALEKLFFLETRPYMQGSRLTAFEVKKMNLPGTLIVDSAAAYTMLNNKVDAVLVGADRIVSNGDTANKIGTFNLSIVAKRFGVPFFVVAPTSSFDFNMKSGDQIPIEQRDPQEITHFKGMQVSPVGTEVINPSFDVTPAELITGGIACEKGLFRPSELSNLKAMIKHA
jgi:methylthioribose-1-phosphate isomerase